MDEEEERSAVEGGLKEKEKYVRMEASGDIQTGCRETAAKK